MGMSTGGGPGSPMADINVTPLVDVMLVLLIIFMITAPLMNQGVEIDLPRASAQPLEGSEDQLVLSIDADLTHYLNDTEVPFSELPTRLSAIAREAPGQPVFVRADANIPYRHVLRAMAVLKKSGMPKVGLVSNPGALDDPDEEVP